MTVEGAHAPRDHLRDDVHAARLRQQAVVGLDDRSAYVPPLGRVGEPVTRCPIGRTPDGAGAGPTGPCRRGGRSRTGNLSAITRSTSVIRVKRAASACSRSFCGGSHRNGKFTSSARWPWSRRRSTSQSANCSAPPRTNGTWVLTTAILIGSSARPSSPVNAATTVIPRSLPRRRQRLHGTAARASDPIAETLGDGKHGRGLAARLAIGRPKRVQARLLPSSIHG